MTPFEAFKLHHALKQHFLTDYDFIKYNGKIKASLENFEKRPDYRRYVLLAKKQHLQDYILANLVGGGNYKWVGDLLTEEAENTYISWRNRNEALTYKFREQLTMLNDDFDSNFAVNDNMHPKLFRLMIEGLVWPETPVILDQLCSYSKQWDKKLADDYMWSHWSTFVKKYQSFVRFDKEKIKSLIINKFS